MMGDGVGGCKMGTLDDKMIGVWTCWRHKAARFQFLDAA